MTTLTTPRDSQNPSLDTQWSRIAAVLSVVILIAVLAFIFWPRHHLATVDASALPMNQPAFTIGDHGDSLIRHMVGNTPAEQAQGAISVARYAGLPIWQTKNGHYVRTLSVQQAWTLADATNSHGIFVPVVSGDYFDPERGVYVESPLRHHK